MSHTFYCYFKFEWKVFCWRYINYIIVDLRSILLTSKGVILCMLLCLKNSFEIVSLLYSHRIIGRSSLIIGDQVVFERFIWLVILLSCSVAEKILHYNFYRISITVSLRLSKIRLFSLHFLTGIMDILHCILYSKERTAPFRLFMLR